jgi:outer membrane protein TolC
MKAMAVADLLGMRAQTRARVSELYASILRARKLAALYRGNVLPQSRAGVTSALSAYRVGQVNLMALLDGQMTVNRYEQELSALDAEQGKALAELEMLIGRELFDANAAIAPSKGSTP